MITLIINGACGQMGRTLLRMLQATTGEFQVLCGVDAFGGEESEGFPVVRALEDAPAGADVIIDFSRPEALPALLAYCQKHNVRPVLCTTGYSESDYKLMDNAAAKLAIFQSRNMSLGVNLQVELIKDAAEALGDKYDVEIVEKHHNLKVDAPSGTALMLAEAVRTKYVHERTFVFGRHSKDARRTPAEIGIHAIRGGTVVGEHEVAFYGRDEVVSVTHRAYSKQVFAAGALRAAQYIMQKGPGRYNMHDIVTEHNALSHVYTDEDQSIITVSNLPNEPAMMDAIFSAVAQESVFVDMISMTTPSDKTADISFSLPRGQMVTALNALKALQSRYAGMDVYVLDNLTKITVTGPGMARQHGVAAKLFTVLGHANVSIELLTTSETKIAFCLKNADVAAALQAIKEQFQI